MRAARLRQLVDRRRTSRTSRPPAQRLAAQYDGYHPFPDLSVNGKQTLSENIADVAGLSAAYDAYAAVTRWQGTRRRADGFTPDQLFFLSFAQSWQQQDPRGGAAPQAS